jgi:Fic family protein
MLIERDLLPEPLLYLSAYFESHRDANYEHLLRVSQKGTWEDWLLFFLRGVLTEARDAARRSGTLFDLREAYRGRFRKEGASATVLAAVEHLFVRPVTDVRGFEYSLDVTFGAARSLVTRLEGEGVLEEITGRRRNRVYVAREALTSRQFEEAQWFWGPDSGI